MPLRQSTLQSTTTHPRSYTETTFDPATPKEEMNNNDTKTAEVHQAALSLNVYRINDVRRHLQFLYHGKLDVHGLSSIPVQRLHDIIVAIECYQAPNLPHLDRVAQGGESRLTVPYLQPTPPTNSSFRNAPSHDAIAIILQATTEYQYLMPRDVMHQVMNALQGNCSDPPSWLKDIMFNLMRPITQHIYERSIGAPWWNWLRYLSDSEHCRHAEIEDILNQAINPTALWTGMKAILRILRASKCFNRWEELVGVWIHLSICRHMSMCLETPNFRLLERTFFKMNQVVFRAIEAGQGPPDWQKQILRRYPSRVRLSYDGVPVPLEGIVQISRCGSFVVHQHRG